MKSFSFVITKIRGGLGLAAITIRKQVSNMYCLDFCIDMHTSYLDSILVQRQEMVDSLVGARLVVIRWMVLCLIVRVDQFGSIFVRFGFRCVSLRCAPLEKSIIFFISP